MPLQTRTHGNFALQIKFYFELTMLKITIIFNT